jgi:hypothetical protein
MLAAYRTRAHSVTQALFMAISLDTAMGLAVWLPYLVGKSTALLVVSASPAMIGCNC